MDWSLDSKTWRCIRLIYIPQGTLPQYQPQYYRVCTVSRCRYYQGLLQQKKKKASSPSTLQLACTGKPLSLWSSTMQFRLKWRRCKRIEEETLWSHSTTKYKDSCSYLWWWLRVECSVVCCLFRQLIDSLKESKLEKLKNDVLSGHHLLLETQGAWFVYINQEILPAETNPVHHSRVSARNNSVGSATLKTRFRVCTYVESLSAQTWRTIQLTVLCLLFFSPLTLDKRMSFVLRIRCGLIFSCIVVAEKFLTVSPFPQLRTSVSIDTTSVPVTTFIHTLWILVPMVTYTTSAPAPIVINTTTNARQL